MDWQSTKFIRKSFEQNKPSMEALVLGILKKIASTLSKFNNTRSFVVDRIDRHLCERERGTNKATEARPMGGCGCWTFQN